MNVQVILDGKGSNVVTTRPDVTIADVSRLLHTRRIGAAPVLDAAGDLVGIISERDIVAGLATYGPEVGEMTVRRLMTQDVLHCHPSDGISEIMAIMTNRRVRHLPVIEDGRLRGLVSIGDVVKARLDEAALEVDSLRQYVLEGR